MDERREIERELLMFLLQRYAIPILEKVIGGFWDKMAEYFTHE